MTKQTVKERLTWETKVSAKELAQAKRNMRLTP